MEDQDIKYAKQGMKSHTFCTPMKLVSEIWLGLKLQVANLIENRKNIAGLLISEFSTTTTCTMLIIMETIWQCAKICA